MNKCSMCGECCRYINIGRVICMTTKQKEYLRAHGVIEDQGFFLVPFHCPNLGMSLNEDTGDPKYIYKCGVHDNKPKLCAEWEGEKYKNHTLFWRPKKCTMGVK